MISKLLPIISSTFTLFSQLKRAKQSDLSEADKQKIIKLYNKMIASAVVTAAAITFSAVLLAGIAVFFDIDMMIMIAIAVAIFLIAIIIFAIIIYKMKKGCQDILFLLDMGFDGKTDAEKCQLMPDAIDKKLVSRYKLGAAIWWIIMLALLIAACSIMIVYRSKIAIIIGVVIFIIGYAKADSLEVEAHRLKSGFYKRPYSYKCRKCNHIVQISMKDFAQYDLLPRNANKIRIMPCTECNEAIELWDYDSTRKSYEEYLNKRKAMKHKLLSH